MAADPDGRMRLLQRLGQAAQRVELVELARVAGGGLGPQRLEDAHVLVGDGAPPLEGRRAHRLELLPQPAHAHAHGDTPAREDVDGGEHLRRHHGVAIGHDHHAGDDPEPARDPRHESHEGQQLEGVSLSRKLARHRVRIARADHRGEHDVVGHDHGVKSQGLAPLDDGGEPFGRGRGPASRQVEAIAHDVLRRAMAGEMTARAATAS